jgi:hypothetical protein
VCRPPVRCNGDFLKPSPCQVLLESQNIYKLVIVPLEALCEDVGWHDVALVGHDVDDYHPWWAKFGEITIGSSV